MSPAAIFLAVLGLALLGWLTGRARAMAFAGRGAARPHSLPAFHGWYVALWAAIPALLFLLVWLPLSGHLVMQDVLASPGASKLPPFEMQRNAILQEARELAE
ncbi:MAG TPA: phosphate ABC transporter permease family protein, partial [Allosphingosinicella sp.]